MDQHKLLTNTVTYIYRGQKLSLRLTLLLFLLLQIALASALALNRQSEIKGKVVSIRDGDTIIILQNNRQYKIRLASIDCPEQGQAFGTQARNFTSRLAFGKKVRAVVKTKDQYGRFVAEVFLPDGRSLNSDLVRNGFAWHYIRYSYDKSLTGLEAQARKNRLGLWKDTNPTPPWQWRKHKQRY
jgi:micrococcal nuclease